MIRDLRLWQASISTHKVLKGWRTKAELMDMYKDERVVEQIMTAKRLAHEWRARLVQTHAGMLMFAGCGKHDELLRILVLRRCAP